MFLTQNECGQRTGKFEIRRLPFMVQYSAKNCDCTKIKRYGVVVNKPTLHQRSK